MVKYAELLIDKTKLGGAFVGLIIVSMITSIPELITEVSQGISGSPATGLSDDIGANAFSTFMLAIASLIFIKSMFIKKIGIWTKITILISFLLTLLMTIILFFDTDIDIEIWGKITIGIIPIFMMVVYIIFVIFSYKFRYLVDEEPKISKISELTIKQIVVRFTFYSILLICASLLINWVVDAMQIMYSINPKSAGGIMLSITTAAPEVIALFGLAKKGHLTAATGSIIGSHIFNLSSVFWGDLAYHQEAIIHGPGVSSVWMIGIIVTIELGFLLIFSLIGKKIKNKFVYAILPILIVFTYIFGWALILALG